MKTGIVDVGGGLRGVYAAGIFDYCLDRGIQFDFCIGVSAGSANVTSYMAGQKKRNYLFYTEYPFRKEYMSIRNFFFKKSYIDMDYLYGTLSNSTGENPLDYPSLKKSSAELLVVATNAQTGEAVYFDKDDLKKRAEHYNQGVQLSKEYESQGRVLIVAPDDTCGVDTLTKNREALQRFYEKGYQDAQAIPEFLKSDI